MKGFMERIILLIAMLIFGFSGYGIAEEWKNQLVDYSSPVVQSFIAMQEAIKNGDYEKAWQLTAKREKEREKYSNNIENFKKHFSKLMRRQRITNLTIKELKPLTDTTVVLSFTNPLNSIYMLKENGLWKVDGRILKDIEKVETHMEFLREAIEKYFEANKKLPSELSELVPDYIEVIPLDLFNDKNEPYVYRVEGDTWMLYSYGPDRRDDGGVIECDLSKGALVSRGVFGYGDIIYRSSN
jgi:hypothetical protein